METEDGAKISSRTRIACEGCRRNKRKCGGEKPICALCSRSSRNCVYPVESRKRKFSDDVLIKTLENQVKALKSIVKAQRVSDTTIEVCDTAEKPDEVSKHQSNPQDHYETIGPHQPDHRNVDDGAGGLRSNLAMEELASLMLTVKLEDQGEPSFTISSGKSRFAGGLDKIGHQSQIGALPGTTLERETVIPLQVYMLEAFMNRFNIFHRVIDNAERLCLQSVNLRNGPIDTQFRNYALFSVAAYLTDENHSRQSREYAELAEGLCLRCIRERPTDMIVQGLSLLSWRELQLGNDSMAYNYIAMATGQILHQGLHVTSLVKVAQPIEVDQALFRSRVRSFWAYFSIDRLVTSSIGMNCTMHWQRVKPPSYLAAVVAEPSIDDIAHDTFNRLWHLWDNCLDQVFVAHLHIASTFANNGRHAFSWGSLTGAQRKNVVMRSHQKLEKFHEGVDSRLKPSTEISSLSVLWFQLSYETAIILVYRPLLNEPVGSSTLELALRMATSAAASISRILRVHRKHSSFKDMLPQVVEYILSAAIIHLLNATTGRTTLGRQSANGLRTCLEILQSMDSRWNIRVSRAISRVQQLAYRWDVLWALPRHLCYPLNSAPTVDTVQSHPVQLSKYQNGLINPVEYNMVDLPKNSSHSLDAFWDPSLYGSAVGYMQATDEIQDWSLDWLFNDNSLQSNLYYTPKTPESYNETERNMFGTHGPSQVEQ